MKKAGTREKKRRKKEANVVVFGEYGVTYTSKQSGQLVTAGSGKSIRREDYEAMTPWERYCVLSFFADQGNEVERYVNSS